MAPKQSFHLRLVATTMAIAAAILLAAPTVIASDADPLQDFCIADLTTDITINGFPCKPRATVVSSDFYSSVIANPGIPDELFGSIVTSGDATNFPGINTLGLSMNRVDFAVGGINPPHTHPRATELIRVAEGELLIGIVTTDNKFYSHVVTAGMNAVIPRAMLHFEANIGNTTAYFITAFNSQQPGVLVASTALFGSSPTIPDFVLSKAYGRVSNKVIDLLKSKFAAAASVPLTASN